MSNPITLSERLEKIESSLEINQIYENLRGDKLVIEKLEGDSVNLKFYEKGSTVESGHRIFSKRTFVQMIFNKTFEKTSTLKYLGNLRLDLNPKNVTL